MFKVLLITIILLALAFAGIAIKMFVKKTGQFEKSCSSVDPTTGDRTACSCGHGDGGPDCENKKREN
ncbi:MAG: hypothetical protein PHD25_03590 [Bacteroidales bacterium]|nr:hypothetical protein [Bacteroidales bacterium]